MKNLSPLLLLILFFSCKKDKVENPSVTTNAPVASVAPTNVSNNSSTNTPVVATKIKITIQNIKSQDGVMRFALFNSAESFNSKQNWVKAESYAISGNTLTIEWNALPAGDYALSVYHDKNNNDELDKNFLGIPQEGFAFSNNAMGTFGPPSFDQAKFKLESASTATQIIDLIFY